MRTIPLFLLLAAVVGACAAPGAESNDPAPKSVPVAAGKVAIGARIDVLGPT